MDDDGTTHLNNNGQLPTEFDGIVQLASMIGHGHSLPDRLKRHRWARFSKGVLNCVMDLVAQTTERTCTKSVFIRLGNSGRKFLPSINCPMRKIGHLMYVLKSRDVFFWGGESIPSYRCKPGRIPPPLYVNGDFWSFFLPKDLNMWYE